MFQVPTKIGKFLVNLDGIFTNFRLSEVIVAIGIALLEVA